MSYDAEKAGVVAAFSEESVRRGFIKKVYSILSVQLLVTFGTVALFNQCSDIRDVFLACRGDPSHGRPYREEPNDAWIAVFALSAITGLLILLAMICVKTLRVKVPINFILLAAFTIAESLMVGLGCMLYDGDLVLIAAAATAVIVIALTIFAFQTKVDFTICRGLMFCVLCVFVLFGFLITIYAATGRTTMILSLVYSAFGVLIFSIYLVIDTQMMMGGHKFAISPEEYVFAAIAIYLDILNLFLKILRLMAIAKRK